MGEITARQMLYEGAEDAIEAFKLLRISMARDLAAVRMINVHIDQLEYARLAARKETPDV